MNTKDYLILLKNEIHTTVMATIDQNGHPVTRVIDVMLVDDTTFYFITAKGKEFYRQLMDQQFVAVSGACGGEGMDKKEASIHMKAISIRGRVQNMGAEKLEEVFEQNPYMKQIYPSAASRAALEVFCMTEGEGEFFDLSTKPITRELFLVGTQWGGQKEESLDQQENREGREKQQNRESQKGRENQKNQENPKRPEGRNGYWITDACIGCGACMKVCPQACIDAGNEAGTHYAIRQENCLHCGNCLTVCPVGAVRKGCPQ